MSCASKHPCYICDAKYQDGRWSSGNLCTFESIKEDLNEWKQDVKSKGLQQLHIASINWSRLHRNGASIPSPFSCSSPEAWAKPCAQEAVGYLARFETFSSEHQHIFRALLWRNFG